VNTDKLNRD